ncbi:hypothetical protein EYF80_027303 [Liparis tanakae]|uniref:Uncharacterized protein n=1 Tax=Liparis tanakae TaxID=230148 RepID=A0A4Z2HAG3_9TELE|nr:hypothetical protein EYF80_027303 [Liparis tanakae]
MHRKPYTADEEKSLSPYGAMKGQENGITGELLTAPPALTPTESERNEGREQLECWRAVAYKSDRHGQGPAALDCPPCTSAAVTYLPPWLLADSPSCPSDTHGAPHGLVEGQTECRGWLAAGTHSTACRSRALHGPRAVLSVQHLPLTFI